MSRHERLGCNWIQIEGSVTAVRHNIVVMLPGSIYISNEHEFSTRIIGRILRDQMTTTTIKATANGNFTVPAKMRKVVGIEEGQHLIVRVTAKKIIIEPIDFSFNKGAALKASEKAGDNIRKGKTLKFKSTKEAIDYLES